MTAGPRPPVRLLAVDMDGTLLDPDGELSPATVDAVRRARRAGLPVVPVTGRPDRLIWDLAAKAGLGPLGVGANGAVLLDLDGGRVLERNGFRPEAAVAVVDLLRRRVPGICLAVDASDLFLFERGVTDDLDLVERPGRIPVEDVRPHAARGCFKLVARRADLTALELAAVVSPVLRRGAAYGTEHPPEPPTTAAAAGMDRDEPGDLAEVTASNVEWVEIGPPGLSKATGLGTVCRLLGIALDEVAAVGDHHNDLPMLRAAGQAFAMGNAVPEVVAVAGRVLPTNAADGVAGLILELLDAG